MKSEVLLAAFALLLSPFASCAEEEVSVQINFVAWGDKIGGLSLGSGKKKEKFTARAFKYSDPVSYSGPRILVLHKSGNIDVKEEYGPISDEDKEHESIPLPAGQAAVAANQKNPVPKQLAKLREEDPTIVSLIRLPANVQHATILLARADQGTYIGYVIKDGPNKLPPGKLRVHNLSPHRIAMQFNGGAKFEMDTRETTLVNAPQGHVIYQLAYLLDGKWKVQENNMIPVSPDEQTHFIVLKSRHRFFLTADGATGGYLQMVMLSRKAK